MTEAKGKEGIERLSVPHQLDESTWMRPSEERRTRGDPTAPAGEAEEGSACCCCLCCCCCRRRIASVGLTCTRHRKE